MKKNPLQLLMAGPIFAAMLTTTSCGAFKTEDDGGAPDDDTATASADDGNGDKGDGGSTDESEGPKPCVRNSDCVGGEICRQFHDGSFCLPECREDRDCLEKGEGYICIEDICKKGSSVCLDGSTKMFGKAEGMCSPGTQKCLNGEWTTIKGSSDPVDEACDQVDNDCDGTIDEDCKCDNSATQACGKDQGECHMGIQTCINGEWGKECVDEVEAKQEVCDGKDNDCDSRTDENIVGGNSVGETCKGEGKCADGIWECDGPSGLKCSTMPGGTSYQGSIELCDGKDSDCDGKVDEDIDGSHSAGDPCEGTGVCGVGAWECASFTELRCSTMPGGSESPGALEEDCGDSLDNNCNGTVNEVCECVYHENDKLANSRLCGSSNVGVCHYGTQECQESGKWGPCVGAVEPSIELCDGIDNDCDSDQPVLGGGIDEDYPVGDACTMPGVCGAGVVECVPGTARTRCSTGPEGSDDRSSVELCDDKDNDCNGATDEDYFVGAFCRGEGACGVGAIECASIVTTRCSTDPDASEDASAGEICDGVDNNCDGEVDEGVKNACGHCGTLPVDGPPNACDNLDNDCDGLADEDQVNGAGCSCEDGKTRPCGSVQALAGIGVCIAGIQVCDAGQWSATCFGVKDPGAEVFDLAPAKDEDCDGAVNEGGVCATGDHRACGLTLGICKPGIEACNAAGLWDGNCVGAVTGGSDGPFAACDNLDNDCDGLVDENCGGCVSGRERACGSNVGICKQGTQTCIGGSWDSTCVGSTAPLAMELCNGLDDNCDGNTPTSEVDADKDGIRPCDSPPDCNDANAQIRPGAAELCDGVDNDCDGQTDEDNFVKFPCAGVGACAATPGVIECASLTAGRCSTGQDGSAFAGSADGPPGACDGVDNDCDGVPDEGCGCKTGDTRPCGSSVGACEQGTQTCVNGAWDAPCVGSTAPLVAEACNGEDDNCDGNIPVNEADADGDGVRVCAGDCNDANLNIRPGATEFCDGVDSDCDGHADDAAPYYRNAPCEGEGVCGTGVTECTTTVSTRCSTNPGGSAYGGGVEACDFQDNDCDGQTDEGVKNACGGCGATPADGPANACDSVDNNCSGIADEGCACNDGAELACGPSQGAVGQCRMGVQVCNNGAWGITCNGAVNPSSEVCDGLDNNCNGQTDEAMTCPAVFTWTPPTAITSTFELVGCYGTSIDAQGRVVCLGWDILCVKQNVSSLNCQLEVPPGYYVGYNARRVGDSYWMVDNAALQGTHSLTRSGTAASGCVVLFFSANDELLRCIAP